MPQGWNKRTRREVAPGQIGNLIFRKDNKIRKAQIDPEIDQTLRKAFDPRIRSQILRIFCPQHVFYIL